MPAKRDAEQQAKDRELFEAIESVAIANINKDEEGVAGVVKKVEQLLEKGANAAAFGSYNDTPLHAAARVNNVAIARLLLDHGADVNQANNSDWTPLHSAAMNGSEDVARLLLERGAGVDALCITGETPLHAAAWAGSDGVIDVLIEHGATVDAVNHDGNTPLHNAVDAGWFDTPRVQTARLLIERGRADVNRPDNSGNTPFHKATRGRDTNMIQLLAEHGANPHAENEAGEVAIGFLSSESLELSQFESQQSTQPGHLLVAATKFVPIMAAMVSANRRMHEDQARGEEERNAMPGLPTLVWERIANFGAPGGRLDDVYHPNKKAVTKAMYLLMEQGKWGMKSAISEEAGAAVAAAMPSNGAGAAAAAVVDQEKESGAGAAAAAQPDPDARLSARARGKRPATAPAAGAVDRLAQRRRSESPEAGAARGSA